MENTDKALAKILNTLADKFGTTVDHLYAILYRQALINGIENLVALLILGIPAIWLSFKMVKEWKAFSVTNTNSYDTWIEENMPQAVVSFILQLMFLTMFFICGTSIIDCLFNPEFYVVNTILKSL